MTRVISTWTGMSTYLVFTKEKMSDKEALDKLRGKHDELLAEVGKVIVGQKR